MLATYPFPGNIRELKAMVYDAVSLHKERILAMDTFIKAIGTGRQVAPVPERNRFADLERLPTFAEAAEMLVAEAMARSKGSQTIAARLLGISQPALSKRLKMARNLDP